MEDSAIDFAKKDAELSWGPELAEWLPDLKPIPKRVLVCFKPDGRHIVIGCFEEDQLSKKHAEEQRNAIREILKACRYIAIGRLMEVYLWHRSRVYIPPQGYKEPEYQEWVGIGGMMEFLIWWRPKEVDDAK